MNGDGANVIMVEAGTKQVPGDCVVNLMGIVRAEIRTLEPFWVGAVGWVTAQQLLELRLGEALTMLSCKEERWKIEVERAEVIGSFFELTTVPVLRPKVSWIMQTGMAPGPCKK
jgi:hypothetical protein